jgi:hypothetical protein
LPLTRADIRAIEERLDASEERLKEIQSATLDTLAAVLERFPNNPAVAAAVDEFLDGTLRD